MRLLEAGSSHTEIAAEYGVSVRTIARWASRQPSDHSVAQGAGRR
ncbi:helix-turn-helix domain-containing protein [Actinomycetospora sp. NBC_00405]